MNSTPTHARILIDAMDARLARVRVALPGRVEAYDPSSQQAEVQPLIMDGDEDPDNGGARVARQLPKLLSVPIQFPGSGKFRITWPVNPGDTVLLVFTSSAIDYWLAVGGMVDPADDRNHDISDAVAIPGLFDFAHVPTQAPTTAMTFHASSGLLGGPTANQSIIRGEAFMSALDTLITSIQSAINSITTVSGGTAAATAIGVAKGVFDSAAATFKSSAWKVA